MNRQFQDDPREVLKILNSLGFIGITAQELKSFLKELNLYRTIKRIEQQQRNEELKRKIVKNQHNRFFKTKVVLEEESSDQSQEQQEDRYEREQDARYEEKHERNHDRKDHDKCKEAQRKKQATSKACSPKKSKHLSPLQKKDTNKRTLEIIVDTPRTCASNCNANGINKKSSTITISSKPPISHQHSCSKQNNNSCSRNHAVHNKQRPVSAPELAKKPETRTCLRRAKSVASSQMEKGAPAENLPRSKSFIRSKSLLPNVKATKRSREHGSDPVALYEKYAAYWNTISFPGQESHAKLRWSVREKMLGAAPDSKPNQNEKKTSKNQPPTSKSTKLTLVC